MSLVTAYKKKRPQASQWASSHEAASASFHTCSEDNVAGPVVAVEGHLAPVRTHVEAVTHRFLNQVPLTSAADDISCWRASDSTTQHSFRGAVLLSCT